MSQKSQSEGPKHFSAGRGLLAAAETLNFSTNDQRSGRQMGGVASGLGGGAAHRAGGSQMSRRGAHIGNTLKLFASLGLSSSDLDALAEIPEEDISVETLPRILAQLKSRKAAAERRGAAGYGGGRGGWDGVRTGRTGPSARAQSSADFGYGPPPDGAPGQGYGAGYGGRERPYPELSHHDSYGGGAAPADPGFRQRRIGPPSNGKVQDFLGAAPHMLPHMCSLCDFDVHSAMVSTPASSSSSSSSCRTNLTCFSLWAQVFRAGLLRHVLSLLFKASLLVMI